MEQNNETEEKDSEQESLQNKAGMAGREYADYCKHFYRNFDCRRNIFLFQ